MVEVISSLAASLFGRRKSTLSIPILDGALKPNNLLEEAPVFAEREGLEDLALATDGTLYAACGKRVFRVSDTSAFEEVCSFDRDVTALAIGDGLGLAVGLGNAVRLQAGTTAEREIDRCDGQPLNAVNALHAAADGTLLISDGSVTRPYPEWRHDLLEKGSSGRLLRHDPRSGSTTALAIGLGYSFGAFADAQGQALVAEAWKHQLSKVGNGGARQVVLPALPGYPARMARAVGGGFWLSVFACRTQLVEFVLGEDAYRHEMMRSIEPRYWVAPALSSGDDFLEPLQGGGVKQMGILKPWAPPRSYGLLLRVGDDFVPQFALHSRVGGRHHGVVAAVQRGDELFVLAKGAGRILRLSAAQASQGAAL